MELKKIVYEFCEESKVFGSIPGPISNKYHRVYCVNCGHEGLGVSAVKARDAFIKGGYNGNG